MITNWRGVHFNKIDSTNSWMLEQYSRGVDCDGLIVTTDFQTRGIGLESSVWHSEANKNILLSLGFHPERLNPSDQFCISMAVSVAIIEVLEELLPARLFSIKWPNDIYFGHKKVAGILISNLISGQKFDLTIIGLGINVNQMSFPDWIPNPTSLALITGDIHDHKLIEHSLGNKIFQKLLDLQFYEKWEELKDFYLKRLYLRNQWKQFVIRQQQQQAMIIGIGAFGHLQLKLLDGTTTSCDLKEIVFLPGFDEM